MTSKDISKKDVVKPKSVKMSVKQKRFCDNYLKCGNATKAAKDAGYSEKTAKAIGSENLTKPAIKGYIDKRIKQIDDKSIADIKEALEFLTNVMRGGVKDQFNLDAGLRERLDATKQLLTRLDKAESKQEDSYDDDGFKEALNGTAQTDWEEYGDEKSGI